MKTTTIFRFLASDSTIATTGFLWGFISYLPFNEVLFEAPLSTTARALPPAVVTSLGAAILGEFLPYHARPLIPVLLVVSGVRSKYKELKIPKQEPE